MMFPLGLAVLSELGRERKGDREFQRYAMAMMLVTSFSATIGGMGTPVGTPPNLIGVGLLRTTAGINVSLYRLDDRRRPHRGGHDGVARAVVPGAAARAHPAWRRSGAHGRRRAAQAGHDDAQASGTSCWRSPSPSRCGCCPACSASRSARRTRRRAGYATLFPESVAAIVGGLLLLVIPVSWRERRFTLSWAEASRIDWGIVLLFGGGLAMGRLADIDRPVRGAWSRDRGAVFRMRASSGLTMVFTAIAVVMSETASNTAAANIIVPTAIAVSQAAGISPLEPALGATIGASLGFMMPISTPPNAIVYSSGYIPLGADGPQRLRARHRRLLHRRRRRPSPQRISPVGFLTATTLLLSRRPT